MDMLHPIFELTHPDIQLCTTFQYFSLPELSYGMKLHHLGATSKPYHLIDVHLEALQSQPSKKQT